MVVEALHPLDLKRKPPETKLHQQTLPGWNGVISLQGSVPIFFAISFFYLPTGMLLLYLSDQVEDITLDYTFCTNENNITCFDLLKESNGSESCKCRIEFQINTRLPRRAYIYYSLTNMYQNHRNYMKSRDYRQLRGFLDPIPSHRCEPFRYHNGKPIAPCGSIANSMFTDEITLYKKSKKRPRENVTTTEKIDDTTTSETESFFRNFEDTRLTDLGTDPETHTEFRKVPVQRRGLNWLVNLNIKFKNPPHNKTVAGLKEAFLSKGYVSPPLWVKNVWELDTETENNANNGFQNEDFIVWMQTGALPIFKKLYRKVIHRGQYKFGLPKGLYRWDIDYKYYKLVIANGRKRIIISNSGIMGQKNPALGLFYIIAGCTCFMLAFASTVYCQTHPAKTEEDVDVLIKRMNFTPTFWDKY